MFCFQGSPFSRGAVDVVLVVTGAKVLIEEGSIPLKNDDDDSSMMSGDEIDWWVGGVTRSGRCLASHRRGRSGRSE